MVLIGAFTGPLAKIPGPFYAKFTEMPWMMRAVSGEQMNTGPEMIKRYGPVIRVAPNLAIFADKVGVRKILLEADLKKSPLYDSMRMHPENANLFTETDKAAYKQSV